MRTLVVTQRNVYPQSPNTLVVSPWTFSHVEAHFEICEPPKKGKGPKWHIKWSMLFPYASSGL